MGARDPRRLAACALLGITVAIPGLSRAGDPWLAFDLQPAAPVVLEAGSSRDAVLAATVRNVGERTVRLERVEISFDAGARSPIAGWIPAATEIEAGSRESFPGLCLSPPASATRARVDVTVSVRRGVKRERRVEGFDVALRKISGPVELALPVRGVWRVTQGHDCGSQHRRGRLGGEFAWDLVALTEEGRTGTPSFPATHRNEDSTTFGREVRAPLSGRVVSAVDGVPDNDAQREFPRKSLVDTAREPRWIFGNYVVLDGGDGRFVLVGHLQRGSIAVTAGNAVAEGALIGRAGNSGNTMLPHVHVQVMDRADPGDPAVSGLPAAFRNYLEVRAAGEGKFRDAVFRKVASGDPPEDAIVISAATP